MYYLFFIFHLLFIISAPFTFEKSIATDASDFNVDELGNLYLIHNTHIQRINEVGNTQFRTSDLNYGSIEYFDITNPLKPFIYYRGLGKLVVFDNTLSQQGSAVDLFEMGYEQVELVSGSRGDAYWMWDARNSELIRVDQNFKRLVSTGNLSVLLSKTIIPVQIIERGKHVYLRDQKLGVFVFDIYGTYRTTLNIVTSEDIQVVNDDIMYTDGSNVSVLGADWINEHKLELPVRDAERVIYFNQRLYILLNDSIQIWKHIETTRN